LPKTEPGGREVILYELNEVPWEIVDHYARVRPESEVARLLPQARCQTTVNEDPNHLQPWRTWPTLHKALYSDEHNSFELGQDPGTFRGKAIWEVAAEHGLSTGVFGALQSWPAQEPLAGGFHVPDTFSRTPDVYPRSLRRFQEFNLAMTREQGFSSDAPLDTRRMVAAGADLLLKGFTPWSMGRTARQLVRERRDPRHKAARPIIQALPSFDLYWRLHRRTRPRLSIFFTNHVASMMHRYWGDAVPDYAERFSYVPDEVFQGFLGEAMDVFDHHLRRIVRWVEKRPRALVMVASSMGQAAIPYRDVGETYVLEDAARLAAALGLGELEEGLAMYPRYTFGFPDADRAGSAARAIGSVHAAGEPLFVDVRVDGLTVSCAVRILSEGMRPVREVTHPTDDGDVVAAIEAVGVGLAPRLGGGNTAYHTPEGILFTYGKGIEPDPSRERISVLRVAPQILELLGLSGSLVGRAEGDAVTPMAS
jgi:hypothetical protein